MSDQQKPVPDSSKQVARVTDSPVTCPECGAKQLGPAATCWLCGKSLTGTAVAADEFRAPPPTAAGAPELHPERFSFSLATVLLIMTLASVCMGLMVALPGLGILACVVMVPVFFRTIRVVRRREGYGRDVSSAKKVSLFLGSFAVASVLVIVVCVAAFCSFCGVCLTMFSMSNNNSGGVTLGLGICALAAACFVAVIKMIPWIRRRYRRDIGEE